MNSSSCSSTMILFDSRPCFKFKFKFQPSSFGNIKLKPRDHHRKSSCKAVFADDAPFAAAIGACMLTSLILPVPVATEEEEESSLTSTDTRLAVMGIMSFIPYFNWLSWVFAWLDTGNRRYAVYSLVYLAPYLSPFWCSYSRVVGSGLPVVDFNFRLLGPALRQNYCRSNLSISPEDSWLPIASILFCIVHIQLEASIRNGDIQGFRLFRNVMDQQSSSTKKKERLNRHQEMSKGSKNEKKNLLSAEEQSRDIGGWEDSQRPVDYQQRLHDTIDGDSEDKSKH